MVARYSCYDLVLGPGCLAGIGVGYCLKCGSLNRLDDVADEFQIPFYLFYFRHLYLKILCFVLFFIF